MKIGRSSIPVNVRTPYTRVGNCDDARWVSVSVLVSLMSNELAQSLKRIIAVWTNIRICRRRKQNWRTSHTRKWWCLNSSTHRTNAIHVQDAKILHEAIVKKPLLHRSSTFKKKGAILIRVSFHSLLQWYPTRKKLHQKMKTTRSFFLVGRRVLQKVLVPLKATSVKFRGRWYQAKKVPHLPSVDCALFFLCHLPASYSSCARDPEQNGPNIRSQGVSSEELP